MTESNIMMELIKERPLVFFDLEATGVNILNDRIVEISVVKIFPDGRREVKTRRINPEMHIPEEASAIHGIYDKDVANEPTFRAISKNFFIYLEDCDLGGYNITKFDIPMLTREFSRAGSLSPRQTAESLMPTIFSAAWSREIFPPHTNSSAARI